MKKSLADVVDRLWQRIMMKMQGHDGQTCADYLRASCQKRLFAAERLKSLSQHVSAYKDKLNSRQVLDSLSLAMDYDHLVLSLRGCLSHTSQLIGAILLYNRRYSSAANMETSNLRAVVDQIELNPDLKGNTDAAKLVRCLKTKLDEPWFKELLEPTVIILHDKSRSFPRISTHNLSEQLLDFGFLLHDMAEGADNDESSIITYCRNMIITIDDFEAEVFALLYRCL